MLKTEVSANDVSVAKTKETLTGNLYIVYEQTDREILSQVCFHSKLPF